MLDSEKSLVHTLEELRDDLKQFIETRYEILRTELSASLDKARAGAVLIGGAALLGLVGLVLLGICVSFAIALAFGSFPNQVGVAAGFLITGVLSLGIAGALAIGARSKLKAEELKPNRTLRVLQHDQEVLKEGVQQDDEQSRFRRRA